MCTEQNKSEVRRPFNFESSSANLKAIGDTIAAEETRGAVMGMNAETVAPILTLRQRLSRDRDALLQKREEIDQKVIRLNGLINDIDRDPGLYARYEELLVAVMSDKYKPGRY